MDIVAKDPGITFRRNIRALRLTGKDLAGRLEGLPEDQSLTLLPAGHGAWTARVRCEDGQEVLLASQADPRREAARWFDSLEALDEQCHAVVVVGLGLGYHVAEACCPGGGGGWWWCWSLRSPSSTRPCGARTSSSPSSSGGWCSCRPASGRTCSSR